MRKLKSIPAFYASHPSPFSPPPPVLRRVIRAIVSQRNRDVDIALKTNALKVETTIN